MCWVSSEYVRHPMGAVSIYLKFPLATSFTRLLRGFPSVARVPHVRIGLEKWKFGFASRNLADLPRNFKFSWLDYSYTSFRYLRKAVDAQICCEFAPQGLWVCASTRGVCVFLKFVIFIHSGCMYVISVIWLIAKKLTTIYDGCSQIPFTIGLAE